MSKKIIFNYATFFNYYMNSNNIIKNNNECVNMLYFTNSTKNKNKKARMGDSKCNYIIINGIRIYISYSDKKNVYKNDKGENVIENTDTLLFSIPTIINNKLFDVHFHFGKREHEYIKIKDKRYINANIKQNKIIKSNNKTRKLINNNNIINNNISDKMNNLINVEPEINDYPINKNEKIIYFHKTVQHYTNDCMNNEPEGYSEHKKCYFQDNTSIIDINNIVCLDKDESIMGTVLSDEDKIIFNEILRRPFINSTGGKMKKKTSKTKIRKNK